MKTLVKSGNRMFTAASTLTLIVAVLHMTGLANDPFNDGWATAIQTMRGANVDIGPMNMTFYSLFEGLWIQVGVLLALLGAKNLIVHSFTPVDASRKVVRALSIVDGITYAGLTIVFAVLAIPPALVSFAALTIAFLIAAISTGRIAPQSP